MNFIDAKFFLAFTSMDLQLHNLAKVGKDNPNHLMDHNLESSVGMKMEVENLNHLMDPNLGLEMDEGNGHICPSQVGVRQHHVVVWLHSSCSLVV